MNNLNKAVELYGKVDSVYPVVRNNITRRKVETPQSFEFRNTIAEKFPIDARLVRELALIHKGECAHRRVLAALCVLRDNGELTDGTVAELLTMSMLRLQKFVKDVLRKHAIRLTVASRNYSSTLSMGGAMAAAGPVFELPPKSDPRAWLDVETCDEFMSNLLQEVQELYTEAVGKRIAYMGTMNQEVIRPLSWARDLEKWVNAQNYYRDVMISSSDILHLDILGIDSDATKWSLDQTV